MTRTVLVAFGDAVGVQSVIELICRSTKKIFRTVAYQLRNSGKKSGDKINTPNYLKLYLYMSLENYIYLFIIYFYFSYAYLFYSYLHLYCICIFLLCLCFHCVYELFVKEHYLAVILCVRCIELIRIIKLHNSIELQVSDSVFTSVSVWRPLFITEPLFFNLWISHLWADGLSRRAHRFNKSIYLPQE